MAENKEALEAVQSAMEGYEGIAVEDETGETQIVTDNPEETPDENDGEESDESSEETSEEVEESGGTDPDIQNALELYKALNSPNGNQIIKALAKAKGIELAEDYDVVEESDEIDFTEFAKERLDPKLGFLADSIGKILKDYDKFQSQRVAQVEQKTAKSGYISALQTELEKFGQSVGIDITDNNNKISAKMVEIGKSMPFTGSDPKLYSKYLDRIHRLAKAELNITDSNVSRAKKINKNLSASAPEASSGGNPTAKHKAPKDISPEDAVRAALQGIRFER